MDVNTVDSQGHTTLYLGVVNGYIEIICILLQNGAITEIAYSIERTSLFAIAEKVQVEVHQGPCEERC